MFNVIGLVCQWMSMLALLRSDWPAEAQLKCSQAEPPSQVTPSEDDWRLEAAAGACRAAGKLQGEEKTILSKFLLHRVTFKPCQCCIQLTLLLLFSHIVTQIHLILKAKCEFYNIAEVNQHKIKYIVTDESNENWKHMLLVCQCIKKNEWGNIVFFLGTFSWFKAGFLKNILV